MRMRLRNIMKKYNIALFSYVNTSGNLFEFCVNMQKNKKYLKKDEEFIDLFLIILYNKK